ncbi:MAG: hypothetical protein AAF366_05980 [Pseudomonadota bacterium]
MTALPQPVVETLGMGDMVPVLPLRLLSDLLDLEVTEDLRGRIADSTRFRVRICARLRAERGLADPVAVPSDPVVALLRDADETTLNRVMARAQALLRADLLRRGIGRADVLAHRQRFGPDYDAALAADLPEGLPLDGSVSAHEALAQALADLPAEVAALLKLRFAPDVAARLIAPPTRGYGAVIAIAMEAWHADA